MGIESYSTTAANNNSSPPNGAPEGWAPSAVNNTIRQIMADIRTVHEDPQWRDLGNTPTYVSATSFTIASDVTTDYHLGRRLKLYGTTMGTLYGRITSSSYSSPNTTITVTLDSGSLTSNLSKVYIGTIAKTNTCLSTLILDPIVAVPRGYISGLTTSNNGTDAEHDIDIAAGVCRDSTDTVTIKSTSTIVKQIDSNWSAGSGAGGFPSGLTLSANTGYFVFLIMKTDGTIDAGFDTSTSAANLLTDASTYTYYRRLGSIRTDASSNILAYTQFGNEFIYDDPILSVDTTIGTTASSHTLSITAGVRYMANLNVEQDISGNNADIYVSTLDANDEAPSRTAAPLATLISQAVTTPVSSGNFRILTNTSSQVRARSSVDSTNFRVATLGWTDYRGQYD